MTTSRNILLNGFLCAILLSGVCASSLRADGGGPVRPATSAETESAKRISTTVGKAMPKLPAGWEVVDELREEDVTQVPVDQEKYLKAFSFNLRWSNPKVHEASNQTIEQEAKATKPGEKNKAKIDALNKENEKIAKEFGEAIAKGDMALAEKKKAELDALMKQMEPLFKEGAAEMKAIVRKAAVHDGEVNFSIRVNDNEQDVTHGTPQAAPVAGVIAYHVPGEEDESGSWKEGRTDYFIGPWKLEDQGEYKRMVGEATVEKGYFKPQTIHLTIVGDDARVKQLAGEIGWQVLKDLVSGS